MMAVRIRADGCGQGDEDDSDDERPSMILRRQDDDAEGYVSEYQPPSPFNPDDALSEAYDELARQCQPIILTAAADVRDP